jgi:DNA-binding transcriptional LysR family regulator
VGVALAGLGHALLPEDESMTHIESGKLVRALADWCPKSLFMLIGSRARGSFASRERELRKLGKNSCATFARLFERPWARMNKH